jgi:hypothetical protein
MSTPQSLGREATAGRLSSGLATIMDLRQPQTSRRSWGVLDWPFKVLTPLQHGSGGGGGPGFVRYGTHGAKVCCTSGHEGEELASGMPKTKHIIAKQVTLVSIELAMIV